jgi:hypothetical protein
VKKITKKKDCDSIAKEQPTSQSTEQGAMFQGKSMIRSIYPHFISNFQQPREQF